MEVIINDVIWGLPLILFLLVISIYFCIKTSFFHFKNLKRLPRWLFNRTEEAGSISSFSTTMLLIGSHIGVGNIIGVGLAIMYGGPGAVFWMWVSALICSMLSFVENTLGQIYKEKISGHYKGGPAYYILYGLNAKFYSKLVAFILFFSIGVLMPMVQMSTIITTVHQTLGVSELIIGIILACLIGVLLFGKQKKFLDTINIIVPFMAIFYVFICALILLFNANQIGRVIILIFQSAFNSSSYYGGLIGVAINLGVRRGVFSNEGGLGVAPNISSQGKVEHPVIQGVISSFCVLFDTIFICTITALIILLTGTYNVVGPLGEPLRNAVSGNYNTFLNHALDTLFSGYGSFIVMVLIFFFAFTSIMGYFVNAESNLYFLFKNNAHLNKVNRMYKAFFILTVLVAVYLNTDKAWLISDLGVGIIGWINSFVLVLLAKDVFKSIADFKKNYS